MQKIKIFHFHNGSGGGVLSVIKNLLKYSTSTQIENHVIYTINKKSVPDFLPPNVTYAASEQIFYYSPQWNFYYTCKQLVKLIPDEKAVIVAHDWLELGMISNLGLQNPVVNFLHGDFEYYYELTKKHEKSIDRFISVSPVIYRTLSSLLPHRKTDIYYCRFPVTKADEIAKENKTLKIIYCVARLNEERKQFTMLPLINSQLKLKGLHVEWTIVGDGMTEEEVKIAMDQQAGISFFSGMPNEELIKLLALHDIFVLPSLKEGFPVAAAEAMKAGCVPLVSYWDGAAEELIIQNETGYYFKLGDAEGYANIISLLNSDRVLLKKLSGNAVKKANELFDPFKNTSAIEEVFTNAYHSVNKKKNPFRSYGSRLDKHWIPNVVTKTIRNIL